MIRLIVCVLLLVVLAVAVHPPIVAACCFAVDRGCCAPSSACCRVVMARDAAGAPDTPIVEAESISRLDGLSVGHTSSPVVALAVPVARFDRPPSGSLTVRSHLALSILRV